MAKIEIVKINKSLFYAIRCQSTFLFIKTYQFLDRMFDYWTSLDRFNNIPSSCKFYSYDEAKKRLDEYNDPNHSDIYGTPVNGPEISDKNEPTPPGPE